MKTYSKIKKTPATKVLIRAQAIISEGWTKNVFAKDSNGYEVDIDDDRACEFCTLGALERASMELNYGIVAQIEAKRRIQALVGEGMIAIVNDWPDTCKEHIFDLFTLAILEGK